MTSIDKLKNNRCLALLIRERWFLGECRDEAICLYLQLDEDSWVEIAPDRQSGRWELAPSDTEHAHEAFGDGESHYAVKNIGQTYKLDGQTIVSIEQKRLHDRIEICLDFANGTDITMRYNLATGESSLYFTHG